jgi:glycosyl transferase family 25
MKVLPVLYINLAGDKERRAHIEGALAQDNLEPIHIRALEPPFALTDALFSNALSVGEIGCYASHMKAWDMLLVSGRPHALVLEDDARVPPNLAELVDKMMGVLPERWDLVHLYDHDCHPSRPLRAVGNEHELVRYSRVPGGCVGYLLSRSGAQKLLRQELRCWPLDTDFRRPWHFLLDSYGIRPPLVDHDSDFASAILKRGPRSRRRRGIAFSSPLHSLQGAAWNPRKLGIRWWVYCLAINSWRRFLKAVGRLSAPQPDSLSRSGSRRRYSARAQRLSLVSARCSKSCRAVVATLPR